MLWGYLQYV
nr:Chain C, Tel1p peptide [synthetic construct]3H7B_F Chain F, Tel1p peptide [synthetic construct]3H9H_C Chain C, Tel1p peptide [synthetic construct]3H9H_F Chain F, Tel1p peptide [synthetic construct]3H9S_C Chain C, Tel1p peptide [synthetic construct]